MSHRHYCGVEGHEWICSDSSCECICGNLMESGADHSECFVEMRDCPEHFEQNPQPSDDDLPPNYFLRAAAHRAERPHCKCGCADAHPENAVGHCVWCNHVYLCYTPKTEAQHFSDFCDGAPEELREASRLKLARLD
jgi:hypothetical protein